MNNSGLVRQLKILKKRSEPKKVEEKNSINFISLVALVISILSIYFQFFYEGFNLNASIIDTKVNNDTISLDLIYNNKGTQDATIINTEIFFYSDKNKLKKDNHIEFIHDKQIPYILSSGKQVFTTLNQKVYFSEKDLLSKSKTNNRDTLRINLRVSYLNDNSLQSEKIAECGWITLDSANSIDYWFIKYQKINLDSDEYFVGSYRSKK